MKRLRKKPVLENMPETVTVQEEQYCLASDPGHLRILLHLIADTAIGVSIWEEGRLKIIVNAPFSFNHTWYIWHTGQPSRKKPLRAITDEIQAKSARLLHRAFVGANSDLFLKGVRLRYAAYLTGGYPVLPNRGELGKVYVRADAALYLFPRNAPVKPKLAGAHFRVL